MKLRVQYFAVLREERGVLEEEISTDARTALDLYNQLRDQHGFSLEPSRMKVVINEEFRDWRTALHEGDHVVFVPPVAGGAEELPNVFHERGTA